MVSSQTATPLFTPMPTAFVIAVSLIDMHDILKLFLLAFVDKNVEGLVGRCTEI